MSEQHTDYRERERPIDSASERGALAPMPAATLLRRKRLIRYGGLVTFLLAVGMSAIPGPKGSSQTVESTVDGGVKTQVQRFFFSRHVGLPFATGRADYNDDGTIKDVSFHGSGFLGNFLLALAIVVGASIFIGRRRRDD